MAHVSINLIDGEGMRKTMPIYFADGTVLADAQSFVTGFVPMLKAVSGGGIVGAEFCVGLTIPAGNSTPLAGSRVDSGATLSFQNAINRAFSHYVPAFLTSFMQNGVVDITESVVATYCAALVTGIGGVEPLSNDMRDLTAILKGKQTTRK